MKNHRPWHFSSGNFCEVSLKSRCSVRWRTVVVCVCASSENTILFYAVVTEQHKHFTFLLSFICKFLSVVDVYCFERKEENWKGLVRLLLCRIPDARFYHETFVLETVTFMAGTRHFPWLFPLLLIMFLLPQKNKTIGNINRALLYIQPVKLIELEQYFVNSCKYQTFCK